MPSVEDIAHCFTEENGIRETRISRKSAGARYHYQIFEYFRFHSEPMKWIHAFEDTLVLIYVLDVGSYCLPLKENAPKRSIGKDAAHFHEICKARDLTRKPILLLVHNIDVLARGTSSEAIGVQLPGFCGEQSDAESVMTHICDSFLSSREGLNSGIWVRYFTIDLSTTLGRSILGLVDDMLTQNALLFLGCD